MAPLGVSWKWQMTLQILHSPLISRSRLQVQAIYNIINLIYIGLVMFKTQEHNNQFIISHARVIQTCQQGH